MEGRVEGRAEGRAEGATSEARALLLKFLAFRFPGWPVPASLHSISNVDVLNRLFDKAAIAKDSASMARTIDRASKGLNF